MEKYDFDHCVDRRRSDAIKYTDLHRLFGREDLLPMWIADMDFCVCPDICDALAERVAHHVYGYSSVPDSLFDSVASWLDRRHGFATSREEMTYIPGVVKGIGFLVNRFSKPGDNIVIQPPVYHPFKQVIEGNGRVVANNPLIDRGDHYEMDLEGLRTIVERKRPSMMILCNPHNPIGIQWSADTLREVADICAKAGVIVVSDEIHGDLMLEHRRHIPFLSVSDNARRIGVMLGAPSKTFNIPGLVSSWCVIKNPELRADFFNWMTANEFNEPTFFATIGAQVAYAKGEEWLEQALRYILDNINYFCERCEELTGGLVRVYRPEASFLVWLDCRALQLDHESLVKMFIDEAGLALNDGEMFGPEGHGFMRMNLAAPRSTIDDALNRIVKAVKLHSRKAPASR